MNIDKYLDIISACRFCFMCRHLSANGLATGRECDTPRSHALIADLVRMDKANLANPDYIRTIYESDLSGANRRHCRGYHADTNCYDEIGLQLALRRDIVEAGLAPAEINAIAEQLKDVAFTVKGTADVLYYRHPCVDRHTPEAADAFARLAPNAAVIEGGDCGTALDILGFAQDAQAVAAKFLAAVKAANCKTLVIPHPGAYHFAKQNFAGQGFDIITSADYLKGLAPKAAKSGKVVFIDSDFLSNYESCNAPRELLAAAGYQVEDFGTNPEESYACGEGAMVQMLYAPTIAKALVERIARFAKAYYDGQTIVVAAPYTKAVISRFAPELKVITVEEAIA